MPIIMAKLPKNDQKHENGGEQIRRHVADLGRIVFGLTSDPLFLAVSRPAPVVAILLSNEAPPDWVGQNC